MTKTQCASKQAKPVTILARYFIKASGRVCYKVRNGESKEYQCCLHSNSATSCTCKAGEQGTRCYHVKACLKREIERGISNFFAALNEFCQIDAYLAEQEYQDMGYLIDAPKPATRINHSCGHMSSHSVPLSEREVTEMSGRPCKECAWQKLMHPEAQGKRECPWQKQYASDPREKMLSAPLNGDRAFSLLKR